MLIDDPYLAEYEADLMLRQQKYNEWLRSFDGEGGLQAVAESYKQFGLHINENGEVKYREWAPSAQALSIFGEFNNWDRGQYVAQKDQFGVFTLTIPAKPDGTSVIQMGNKYKIQITAPDGSKVSRNLIRHLVAILHITSQQSLT